MSKRANILALLAIAIMALPSVLCSQEAAATEAATTEAATTEAATIIDVKAIDAKANVDTIVPHGPKPSFEGDPVIRSPYIPSDPKGREYRANATFQQRLDTQIPLDLVFRDSEGKTVQLADYFNQGKPIVLSLVYYRCPGICNAVMNGQMMTFKALDLELGKDFEALTVSFLSDETHATAAAKKQTYIDVLDKPGADQGWHFLVGEQSSTEALCDAAGFSYSFVETSGEYAHSGGILFVTPEGRISRYIPGLDYPVQDTRLALMDASEGRIGSLVDKIFALCFTYDPQTGMYGPIINRSLLVGCLLAIASLGGLLFYLIRYDMKHHQKEPVQQPEMA